MTDKNSRISSAKKIKIEDTRDGTVWKVVKDL